LLAEARRLLAPGGIDCISTNNLASRHNVVSLSLGVAADAMHVSDELIVGNPLDPERGHPHADAVARTCACSRTAPSRTSAPITASSESASER
jgi:hypothetical protein